MTATTRPPALPERECAITRRANAVLDAQVRLDADRARKLLDAQKVAQVPDLPRAWGGA